MNAVMNIMTVARILIILFLKFILLGRCVEKCLELRRERGAVLRAMYGLLYVESKWNDFETDK